MPAHLLLVALDDVRAQPPSPATGWLGGAEVARLQALTSPLRRRQYLAGHWLLRVLAAQAEGAEPADWQLRSGPDPRPRVMRTDGTALWASLSHAGEFVAVAVAGRPLGVDVEWPRPGRRLAALSRFVLAPEEAGQVASASTPAEQGARFYRYWTLKEAWAKRSGAGLQPSRARATCARPSAQADAEAWAWDLPGAGHLALAGWPGLTLSPVSPLPGPASGWRYAALT